MKGISFDFSRKSTGVVHWHHQEPVRTEVWKLPAGYLGEQLSKLECALTLAFEARLGQLRERQRG